MAQKVDSANVRPHHIYWTCGLVVTYDSYRYGDNQYVDVEEKWD